MKFINPSYDVKKDKNIFTIRKEEYEKLEETIREILKPAEELGFTVTEFGIKEPKFSSGELFKTLKKNLVIKLQKSSFEVDLSMFIPKLLNDNYIQISGRKKIPLFQLFDIPFVTRGENIKLRTNVASLMVCKETIEESKKHQSNIYISMFSKRVSLALVTIAYFGYEKIGEMFDFSKIDFSWVEEKLKDIKDDNKRISERYKLVNPLPVFDQFLMDLKEYYEASENTTRDEFTKEIGENYSTYDCRSKGEDLLYALDLILKTDVLSAKFFTTGTVLGDLLEVIKNSTIDDTNFINKRIRCFEYIIISKVSKAIFDLCMSNRTSKQPKFNINSSQILSDCNVSNIIQFDFSINPIEELTLLSRTSLVGPGGFNRENVPYYLRDIQPSMFGRLCPVDTPDRENCGILQSLLPNVDLDENLKFTEKAIIDQPISIPVSMVPFLKNDDQTRLQMASSQMRQAIMLFNFDQPMIKTGCEGLYTNFTQFVKIAKKDGQIMYVDSDFVMILYDDGEFDLINVSLRKIYVENLDILEVYVTEGMKVKKGDIIAESNYCKNGEINIGKNLLTAIMPKDGYNYEDGIIISDRLIKENIFTSVHVKDLSFVVPENKVLLSLDPDKYRPLPKPFISQEEKQKKKYDLVPQGKPYAILKEIPGDPMEYYSIFKEEICLSVNHDLFITDVKIFVNKYNEEIQQYSDWIEKTKKNQLEEEKKIQNVIYNILPKPKALQFIRDNNLDRFSFEGKYKIKGEEINGMLVEMSSIYLRNIEVGDKVGNRHGNKGVISRILQADQMPKLEDGRHVDICINPLGIISRMNVGQVFESNLAMSLNDLKGILRKFLEENKPQNEIKKYLLKYIKIIDNTVENWYMKQFKSQLKNIDINEEFINNLYLIQPPFESTSAEMILKAMKYTNTPTDYKIFDPGLGETLLNSVCVGFMYFFRMVHIAEHKLSARGIAMYNRKTLQPPGGRKSKGGQRMGEMETNCLIGHGALKNLSECITTKSDCIDLKNQYIKSVIDSNYMKDDTVLSNIPESVNLLRDYLIVTGLDMKD